MVARVAIALVPVLLLAGCGGPAEPPVGVGAASVTCNSVHFAGSGTADWRRQSAHIGPFGLGGPSHGGHPGPDFQRGGFNRDGLLRIKTPTLVEGQRRVELSVPAGERERVGILTVDPKRGYARVTFVPCADRQRTIWAGGLVLRDRAPVRLAVRVGDGPLRELLVGG
ncbi:MAG TPA: hypothetical protein VIE64_06080 [Solirubrobacterales bacterium]